jgi:signal transduction histidine kinase
MLANLYFQADQVSGHITTLEGASKEICLTVHDSGVGFDPRSTTNGLGLTSMTERLKLVDGKLSVDSNPQSGTTISARVALNSKSSSDVSVA